MASLDQNYNTGIVPPHLRTGGPLPPTPVAPKPPLVTGGPQPPIQLPTAAPIPLTTGGPQPPIKLPTVTPPATGGPQPPVPVPGKSLTTGGPNPPVPANTGDWINQLLGQISGNNYVANPVNTGLPGVNFGAGQTVQDMLNSFLQGPYAADARRRGAEQANQRGMLNSSIAAGASERAAMDRVQPLVNLGMGLQGQREQLAFQQQEKALDRIQQVNNAMLGSRLDLQKMGVDAKLSDWLQTNQFNNKFNAELSMLPVANSMQMLQSLTQYALQEPEVFTPEVMSGFTTFFNNNMLTMLQQYFPNKVKIGGGS